jgi:hypothetical protein
MRASDPIVAARAAARTADRYIGRDREPPTQKSATKQMLERERRQLEIALEIVRKALPRTKTGAFARERLDFIERTLIRDYGLGQTIRPVASHCVNPKGENE